MKYIVFTLTLWFVLACDPNDQNDKAFILQGAWMLEQVDYPIGHTEKYAEAEGTLLRLYDGSNVMYQCWLVKTESGLIVKPHMQRKVTLINKGNGEYACAELVLNKEGKVLVLPHEYGTYSLKNGWYSEMGRKPIKDAIEWVDKTTTKGTWMKRHDIWKKKTLPDKVVKHILDCCKTKETPDDVQQLIKQNLFK